MAEISMVSIETKIAALVGASQGIDAARHLGADSISTDYQGPS
jgi:hypothetical protein